MQVVMLGMAQRDSVKGFMSLVDDEDYDVVSKYKWHANSRNKASYTFYAEAHDLEKGKRISMHRLIMGDPIGMVVDHINGNGLDNRKENLRVCTISQNLMNKKASTKNVFGYKGVERNNGSFVARIQVNGKRYYLGNFRTPKEAAEAYNKGALKHHGSFAKLNEIKI